MTFPWTGVIGCCLASKKMLWLSLVFEKHLSPVSILVYTPTLFFPTVPNQHSVYKQPAPMGASHATKDTRCLLVCNNIHSYHSFLQAVICISVVFSPVTHSKKVNVLVCYSRTQKECCISKPNRLVTHILWYRPLDRKIQGFIWWNHKGLRHNKRVCVWDATRWLPFALTQHSPPSPSTSHICCTITYKSSCPINQYDSQRWCSTLFSCCCTASQSHSLGSSAWNADWCLCRTSLASLWPWEQLPNKLWLTDIWQQLRHTTDRR